MSLQLLMAMAAMSTAGGPVTRIYTMGAGATETVPAGVSLVKITADGPGGAGARDQIGFDPGGGGGGARCIKTIAVIPGNTMIFTVALAVDGRSSDGTGATGTASTVTGAVSGGAVAMSAGPGEGGNIGSPGGGGTASGGDTNTAGQAGFAPDGGAGASGAAGGTSGTPAGTAPGGGGRGKITGTSGPGARGQITFEYS